MERGSNVSKDVAFIDADTLTGLQSPIDTTKCLPFLSKFLRSTPENSSQLVKNINTTTELVRVGSDVLPLTINDTQFDNSWVCSPYNATVTYPLEELRHIDNSLLRFGLSGMIHSLAPSLQLCRINRVVCVNNWLLSTNLYPEITRESIRALTSIVTDRFPEHAILFRSLNSFTNSALMTALKNEGYLLAPSRQVYLYDGRQPEYLRTSNTKRDCKLLETTTAFSVVPHQELSSTNDSRIKELYNLLYLKKYSNHNPQFSERLIRLWREPKMMQLFGLQNPQGRLDGIVGTFTMNGVMTAPLVGYDIAQPQSLGLYRMLMAQVLKSAATDKVVLNLSAGAASFKRLRGGRAELEYSAVYTQHLPFRQRAVWATLATILEQVGGRVLRRLQL